MDDKERLDVLEALIARMLQPLRDVPFSVIVRSLSGHQLIQIEQENPEDQALIECLKSAIQSCAVELTETMIVRPRPNEVGNDVEAYVARAIARCGLTVKKPTSKAGRGMATGYPDLLIEDRAGRSTYLECKIFEFGKPDSTLRSFYLSPSEHFKVSRDARHLLLAFGMQSTGHPNSGNRIYRPRSYKLIDLHDLLCDVKYEFNSDNRRLYAPSMVLSQGAF